jgi:hypothetical protein
VMIRLATMTMRQPMVVIGWRVYIPVVIVSDVRGIPKFGGVHVVQTSPEQMQPLVLPLGLMVVPHPLLWQPEEQYRFDSVVRLRLL